MTYSHGLSSTTRSHLNASMAAAATGPFNVGQQPLQPSFQQQKPQISPAQLNQLIEVCPGFTILRRSNATPSQKAKVLKANGYTPETSPELANYLKILEICSREAAGSTLQTPFQSYTTHLHHRNAACDGSSYFKWRRA